MNIKRFIINGILGIIAFNAVAMLVAALRGTPFQFNAFYGLAIPVVSALASAFARTPKEKANHL